MLLTRSRVGFAAVITVLIVAGFGFLLLTAGAHPYILTRFSATKAIRSAAEFQHKTKVSIAGGNPWPISSDLQELRDLDVGFVSLTEPF